MLGFYCKDEISVLFLYLGYENYFIINDECFMIKSGLKEFISGDIGACDITFEKISIAHAIKQNLIQTSELCMVAVKQCEDALKYVKEQTPELCMVAVKQSANALYIVKEQTPELCMVAVKQYGSALRFVKEQTTELCMAAIKQYGWILRNVKKQTQELCMAAVKQNKNARRLCKIKLA